VRFLADSNIVAQAMRAAGHDAVYLGERRPDPGDQALLTEAVAEGRIILTKAMISEFWFIVICNRIAAYCFSTIWVDAAAEAGLILATLSSRGDRLVARAFLRAGEVGIRESRT
jgi:hypothetical protein